jgi:hypothetical protein
LESVVLQRSLAKTFFTIALSVLATSGIMYYENVILHSTAKIPTGHFRTKLTIWNFIKKLFCGKKASFYFIFSYLWFSLTVGRYPKEADGGGPAPADERAGGKLRKERRISSPVAEFIDPTRELKPD